MQNSSILDDEDDKAGYTWPFLLAVKLAVALIGEGQAPDLAAIAKHLGMRGK
jgi:hypothetical protein